MLTWAFMNWLRVSLAPPTSLRYARVTDVAPSSVRLVLNLLLLIVTCGTRVGGRGRAGNMHDPVSTTE